MKCQRRLHPAWGVFLGTCIVSVFGYGMSNGTSSIFMPVIIGDLGITYASYSVSSILSTAVLIVCMPIVGKIAHKVSPKIITSAAAILLALGFFLRAAVTSVWGIYGCAILMGIGSSALTGMYASILLTSWFESRLGSVIGIMSATGGFSAALLNPVASYAIVQFGWRQASAIMGIVTAAVLLPTAAFLLRMPSGSEEVYRKATTEIQPKSESIYGLTKREIRRLPAYYLIIVATVAGSFISMLPTFTGTQALSRGFDLVQSGYVSSFLMTAAGIAKILLGILLDRFGPRTVLPAYALLGACGMLGMGYANSYAVMLCSAFLTGIGTSILSVSLPFILKSVIGNREYSQTYSGLTMVTCVAPLIIAVPIGMLYDAAGSYSIYYAICAGLIAVAGVLLVSAYKKPSGHKLKRETSNP